MAFDTLYVKAVEGLLSFTDTTAIDQPAHHQHSVGGEEIWGEWNEQ